MLQKFWYMIGRYMVTFYAFWILKIEIRLKASIPDGAKIIIANHPSTTDPAWVSALFNEQLSILITEILFKVPLFGQSLKMAGHIPVIHGKGNAALEEAACLIKQGRTVAIFPEGDISHPDGSLKKAHTGAARLALMTGAPVVPIGIGLSQAHMRKVLTHVDGKDEMSYFYLNGPYVMTIGESMQFSGDVEDRQHVHEVLGEVMEQLASLSQESHKRVQMMIPKRLGIGNIVGFFWQLSARLIYRLSMI